MTLGVSRQTLAQRLLADYRATGRLPRISGGDHEGEGESGGDTGENQGDQNGDANSGGEQGGSSGDNGFRAITSQAELDNLIGRRLDRERKKLAKELRDEISSEITAEARRKEAEEQGNYKELHQTAEKRVAELEAELARRDRDALREKIARKHNLITDDNQDALEFVSGDDADEIEASVKKLAKLAAHRGSVDTDSGKPNAGGGAKQRNSVLANWKFGA